MTEIDRKLQDEIVLTVYCGPQPPYKKDGADFPDRITEEQYTLLKNCGMNLVFGHEDIMNKDTESYAFRALDIAQKVGIGYLVKDDFTLRYCGLGKKYKDFRAMTEEERKELDDGFRKSLMRYKDHPAFASVVAADEPGSDMFPGIARAKKVFDEVCPGKIFWVGLYPYYISAAQYQFSWECMDWKGDEIYAPYVKPNILRYEPYLDNYIKTVDNDILCYDAYPFMENGEVKHNVHMILYELQQAYSKAAIDNGKKFWLALQNGGGWCSDERIRITSLGEVALGVSLALAYGAKGMLLYTGCFPNCCWTSKTEHSGVIDLYGNITEQYPLFQYVFMQVKAIQKYIVHASLKGYIVSGEYFGMLPSDEVIERQNAPETIFRGKFPEYANMEINEYKELKKVEASSQAMVSCFDNAGESVFLVVNNSPFVAMDVKLTFDGEYEFEYIVKTVAKTAVTKTLEIYGIPAGENVLVRIIKK